AIALRRARPTLLNALGKFIPPDERLLLIEDTAEIQLGHANLVRFEARREQTGLRGIYVAAHDLRRGGGERFAVFLKPPFGMRPTVYCLAKFAEARPSTFFNS